MQAQSPIHLKTGHLLHLLCAVILSSFTLCLSLPEDSIHSFSNSTISNASGKDHFTLKLRSSSPDVLDSSVQFTAQLLDVVGPVRDKKLFKYIWTSNANHLRLETKDDFYANITKTFSSSIVDSGRYNMTVFVHYANCSRIICPILSRASLQFNLTDSLNGVLKVKQSSVSRRVPNVYSTEKPVTVSVNITDKFKEPVHFKYKWLVNGELFANTTKPHHNLIINCSGVYTLEVRAQVHIPNPDNPSLDLIHSGSFAKKIILKDPLKSITVSGQKRRPAGNGIYKVECSGSFPTSQCWKLSKVTNTTGNANISNVIIAELEEDVVNTTCSPTLFFDTCQYKINITLDSVGSYRLHVTLLNDVSLKSVSYNIQVFEPDHESVLYLIPVVFICIAVVLILMGLVYTMHVNRRKRVEVADFDFRRRLKRNQNVFKRIAEVIRSLFHRDKYIYEHRHATFHESTAKHYGSFEASVSL